MGGSLDQVRKLSIMVSSSPREGLMSATPASADEWELRHHRLIVPADSNHHGTLYAGSLLRIALECAYAVGHHTLGQTLPDQSANLVLRDVLHLGCHRPVPVGAVVDIRSKVLSVSGPYLIVGLLGKPLSPDQPAWMDALMGFVQIGHDFRPKGFNLSSDIVSMGADYWLPLREFLAERSRRGPNTKNLDPAGW